MRSCRLAPRPAPLRARGRRDACETSATGRAGGPVDAVEVEQMPRRTSLKESRIGPEEAPIGGVRWDIAAVAEAAGVEPASDPVDCVAGALVNRHEAGVIARLWAALR